MAAMQANLKFKRTTPIENIPVPERKKKVLSVQKVRGRGGGYFALNHLRYLNEY